MTSSLAKATFGALKPWINVWDCGVRGEHSPVHLIPKDYWKVYDQHKNGEMPVVRHRKGNQLFSPQKHIGMRQMSSYRIDQHLAGTKHYFTSNQYGKALLMIDVDWHKLWQKARTDEQQRVIKLLSHLFPTGFHVPSERGHHVFIKTNYYTVAEINNLINRLQSALKELLLSVGFVLDIEVKGSVTAEKSGSLAQLPCRAGWWSWERLEEFKASESINSLQLESKIKRIESFKNPNKAAKTKLLIKKIDEQWAEREELLGDFAHVEFSDFREEEVDSDSTSSREKPVFRPEPENPFSTFTYPVEDWHPDEPDAFERTRKVLLPFFRSFYKEHRREPSANEGISFLQQHGLCSGAWEEGESERIRRVKNVIAFISNSFDPKKLRSAAPAKLDHGLIRWAEKWFAGGITGTLSRTRNFDFSTLSCGEETFHVPIRFVAHFVQLLNLWQQNPDENDGLATSFFKENWNRFDSSTYSAPAWNQDYFRVVRDYFDRHDFVEIYDRTHGAGKCWRWRKGERFPQKYSTKKVGRITGNGRWIYSEKKLPTTVQSLYEMKDQDCSSPSQNEFLIAIGGRSPP